MPATKHPTMSLEQQMAALIKAMSEAIAQYDKILAEAESRLKRGQNRAHVKNYIAHQRHEQGKECVKLSALITYVEAQA